MELMFALPLLLGAALLGLLFDGSDDGDAAGTPTPTPPPVGAFSGATDLTQLGDVVNGTAGPDMIKGLAGDDEISGGNGKDVLFGGEGLDTLSGGNATDILVGGNGNDSISGGGQDDYIIADNGADISFGNNGNDTIFGGFGGDKAFGADGDDLVVGHRGEDLIRGGNGNDIVTGNMLYTGIFNAYDAWDIENDPNINQISDIPRMGDIAQRDDMKEDTVYGDAGDDTFYLGDQDHGFAGLNGNDIFHLSPESGTNTAADINGFDAADDQIIVQYYGDTAPVVTVGDDGAGNATVLADGVTVGLVMGNAGLILATDVSVEMIPLFTG